MFCNPPSHVCMYCTFTIMDDSLLLIIVVFHHILDYATVRKAYYIYPLLFDKPLPRAMTFLFICGCTSRLFCYCQEMLFVPFDLSIACVAMHWIAKGRTNSTCMTWLTHSNQSTATHLNAHIRARYLICMLCDLWISGYAHMRIRFQLFAVATCGIVDVHNCAHVTC